MTIVYSQSCINNRLLGVVTTIDAGVGNGIMVLLASGAVVSTITLQKPSATVNGGVLTFSGPLSDPSALGSGFITAVQVKDSGGNLVISDFSVGIPGATADVIISNGLNSTFITFNQVVQVLAAQIIGS